MCTIRIEKSRESRKRLRMVREGSLERRGVGKALSWCEMSGWPSDRTRGRVTMMKGGLVRMIRLTVLRCKQVPNSPHLLEWESEGWRDVLFSGMRERWWNG